MRRIILDVSNLSKTIGKKTILKNVDLKIFSKEIVGIVGPNGAGKTTLLKVITRLQYASSGTVCINGNNINKEFEKAIVKVGALIESPDLYNHLTGYQNLKINACIHEKDDKQKLTKIAKLVGLQDNIYKKVCKYSLGMKQRLGIAIALLNEPNLLILDEPTNGLDPSGIKELKGILKVLVKKENIAIIISSHNLKELECLCTKVVLLKNGQIIEKIKPNKNLETIYFERMGKG